MRIPSPHRALLRVVSVLTVTALALSGCTGGGDDQAEPTSTASPDPEPTATSDAPAPTASSPATTPATTPPATTPPATTPAQPSMGDELEQVVEFVVGAELHNITVLEVLSGGFEHELLSSEANVDAELFMKLVDQWARLAAMEDPTLASLTAVRDSAVARALVGESMPPVILENSDAPEGVERLALGLLDSAAAFFDWVRGTGDRAQERVLAITAAMSEAEVDALVAEWAQLYPDQASGVTNGAELAARLGTGDLDPSRVHVQLLDVSATSVDAPRYGQLAQDEGALLTQIAFAEGVEGLERGVEFNVEASAAVLNAQFPGISTGTEYAEAANAWVDYTAEVYGDGEGSPSDVLRDELANAVPDPFGEPLSDYGDDVIAQEVEALIAMTSDQALGAGGDDDLGVLADAGFVRVDSEVRAIVATAEPDAPDLPALTVALPEPDVQAVALPAGDYDVRGFDASGAPVVTASVAVEAGWEKPAGPLAAALRGPRVRLGEIEAEIASASPGNGEATPEPTVVRWVKVSTEVNPDGVALGYPPPTEPRFEGTVNTWTISEQSMTQHVRSVDRGFVYWDWTFDFAWDSPPDVLEPGETVTLIAGGDRSDSQAGGGFPGAAFEYRVGGGATLGYGRDQRTVAVTGTDESIVSVDADAQAYALTAPSGTFGEWELNAFMWNLAGAWVRWRYEAQEITVEAPEPTVPIVSGFTEEYGWDRYEPENAKCERFASDLFRVICDRASEVEDTIDRLTSRREVARLSGLDGSQDCLDAPAGGERTACEIGQLILAQDAEGCRMLVDDEAQRLCLMGIAGSAGRPELILDLGDESIRDYVASTGDLSVAGNIADPELHDEAISVGLVFATYEQLFAETADTRVPPPDFCARLQGGYQETRLRPYGITEGEAFSSNHNLCEDHLMVARALHDRDPAVCDGYAARIDVSTRDWVVAGGEQAVRNAHRDRCLDLLADLDLVLAYEGEE